MTSRGLLLMYSQVNIICVRGQTICLPFDIPAYTTHLPAGQVGGVRLAFCTHPGDEADRFPWDHSKIAEDFGQNSPHCTSITRGWRLH